MSKTQIRDYISSLQYGCIGDIDSYLSKLDGTAEWGGVSLDVDNGIAVLSTNGIIGMHITEAKIDEAVNNINNSDDINGVLFKINSPGGEVESAFASYERLATITKPVVALVEEMACSAGYMFACSADKIVSLSSAKTGNIGCVMIVEDKSEAYAKDGIKHYIFASHSDKINRPDIMGLSEEDITKIQSKVQSNADRFVELVSSSRNVDMDRIDALNGEALTARKALEAGLIDYRGNETKAINVLNELTNLNTGIIDNTDGQSSQKNTTMENEKLDLLLNKISQLEAQLNAQPIVEDKKEPEVSSEASAELTEAQEMKKQLAGEVNALHIKAYGQAHPTSDLLIQASFKDLNAYKEQLTSVASKKYTNVNQSVYATNSTSEITEGISAVFARNLNPQFFKKETK